jgi:transposase
MKLWRTARSSKVRGSSREESPDPRRRQAEEIEQLKQENERLRDKVIEQAKQIADAEKQVADAEKQVADAEKQVADAEKQIADLERQLALRQQNSTTSSKPPSSDGLAGRPRERGRRKKSRRRPGGQWGHPGHSRFVVPLERVNQVVEVFPDACRHCHHRLPARGREVTGAPRRHQVTELPPIEAHITEYQCPSVVCPACGKSTHAPLPEDVAGQFGPQLTALIAYLTVVCRLPRRLVQTLLEGALQIPISLGSTQAAWEEASGAVAGPCQALERALTQQPVLNSDETGFRTNGDKRYLWAVVAPAFVVYRIAKTRGAAVLIDLLGQVFAGILCSDRLATYTSYQKGRLQFCWAHFRRNLLSAQDLAKTRDAQHFCREALALEKRLFRLWYRFRGDPTVRGGPLTRQQLVEKVLPLQQQFFALGERSLDSANDDVRNLATALFEQHDNFFVFVHHEGVEPTNNRAELALRTAVQWRKIMFGNRSESGELAVARLLTVTRTCQMQQLNALVYLTAAICCYRRGQMVASLLPKQR